MRVATLSYNWDYEESKITFAEEFKIQNRTTKLDSLSDIIGDLQREYNKIINDKTDLTR